MPPYGDDRLLMVELVIDELVELVELVEHVTALLRSAIEGSAAE